MGYKTDTTIGRLYEQITAYRKYRRAVQCVCFVCGVIAIALAMNYGYPEDAWILYILPIGGYGLISFALVDALKLEYIEKKKERKTLMTQYMKDYFLTMQLREPEGDTILKQFLSLAGEGLPPLKVWMVDHEDEDIPKKILTDYTLDIFIKTDDGIFLLKYFKLVKMDDVKIFYEKIDQHDEIKKKHLLRAVILGKEFDEVFYEDGFKDDIENLYEKYKIPRLDLFKVKDVGFQAMWISHKKED